jgi:pimeloyl-ACP methyl ester carboxylesterase
MSYPSFRQIAYILGDTYSTSTMARAEGIHWPPPPEISLRGMLSFVLSRHMQVTSVTPPPEPVSPRTTKSAGYLDAPSELLDGGLPAPINCPPSSTEGRLAAELRAAAQLRDGNVILKQVADHYATNFVAPGSYSQDLLTAMTQLAATGSSAFAAWSANPTQDVTSYLIGKGMPPDAASTDNQQIMSDFHAALQAVRNPGAGIQEHSLRQSLKHPWIAVSGEDDPPDYPVNVAITPHYPQYHLGITVQGTKGPVPLNIRYIIASSQNRDAAPATPSIPLGDEVILYIHGEGSRAEEALDFIPALFAVGAAAGRSFTVIAFDQPSCGYSTMVPHLSVAPMPPTKGHFIDTSPFAGSPILDFVENTIVTFVETLMASFRNTITAVVGGSLGGHMALRLAASQKDWVRNVVAWSPASVMDHDVSLLGKSFPQRMLTDPHLAGLVTDGPSPPWPESSELPGLRSVFFKTVWCQDTFNPKDYEGAEVAAVAGELLSAGLFPIPDPIFGFITVAIIIHAINDLPTVPPQPQMWYRADWLSKLTYIEESRRDRREVYNVNFRQWHWRICEEMIGFKFDTLAPRMNKPLLLMVGELDQYPEVNFFSNVSRIAATLGGLGKALTVQDTGHSIHNERPYFLANQIVRFAPRP